MIDGPGTYKLNYFPLAWDSSGTAPQGPVHIVANVKLTDHNSFSGPFTLDVFSRDGNETVNASGPPIAHLTGNFSGSFLRTWCRFVRPHWSSSHECRGRYLSALKW